MKILLKKTAWLTLLCALTTMPAGAEPPMAVDDAAVMAQGNVKIESALTKDGVTRGGALLLGLAPLRRVETNLIVIAARDGAVDPATRLFGRGIALKWVPIQNETGWSVGASLIWGCTRIDERANDARQTEKTRAFVVLATYRLADGRAIHANFGTKRVKTGGGDDTLGTWGLGYEYPLATGLQLTVEAFGAEKARADKAIGLRYEIAEGFKLSGALGRGNDRSFGQVGFAWEF